MNQYATPIQHHKPDTAVVIEATLKGLIADGSRTFLPRQIAEDCRERGHQVKTSDVSRYFKHSEYFAILKKVTGGTRWQLVGDFS